MRRRWLLWLLGSGACFLSACATTERYVQKCAAPTPQFEALVTDLLPGDDYNAQLERCAAQTAVCVVNQIVADFLGRHGTVAAKVQAPPVAASVVHARDWLVMHGEPR